ncbi:thioesterase II family protein [Streptomyces cellulosae]
MNAATVPSGKGELTLYCLPYAGGAASMYYGWADGLPPWVRIAPILLPGRDGMPGTPPRSVRALARAAAEQVLPQRDKPFALFGYSMGALVAYELSVLLQREFATAPRLLLVAAHPPPHQPREASRLHTLQDEDFVRHLVAARVLPAELTSNAELLASALPLLRADATAVETYRFHATARLDCPVTVISGRDDPLAPPAQAPHWADLTTRAVACRTIVGDHFFVRSHRPSLLCVLAAELELVHP